METNKAQLTGYLSVITATIIWGSIGIFVRLMDIPVPIIMWFRVFFAGITVFTIILIKRDLGQMRIGKLAYKAALAGLILTVNWFAYLYALRLTSIANAVFIMYTFPIIVAILAPKVLGEQIERTTIIALIVSLAGTALIASPSLDGISSNNATGIFAAIIGAITYAIAVLVVKPLTSKVNTLVLVLYEELASIAVLSPVLIIYKISLQPLDILILFIMGAVHLAFAAILYVRGLRLIKAQHVGIFSYFEPLSAVIFAALILGDRPGVNTVVGGFLIIAAGFLIIKRPAALEQRA